MKSTATIAGVGTALPPSAVQAELWDGFFARHYSGGRRHLAQRIFANAGVRTRQAAVSPLLEDVSEWSTERRMRRYQVEALPRPARRIPIVLAVNPVSPDPKVTERAMRRVARLADGWQTDGTPPRVFAERWRQVREYAAEYAG